METFNLGKQIAFYRKQKGLTQDALANQLGVTNQAVSKWESDQCCPDVQLLPRLADLFGISLDVFFGRAEVPAPVIDDLPWEDDEALRAVFYIGHRLQKHDRLDFYQNEKQLVEFHWDGPAINVYSDFSVVCTNCIISGSVQAGDSVTCGDVSGSVSAGDGITCGDIGGSVSAGDSVRCKNIHGSVRAGDGVYYCG